MNKLFLLISILFIASAQAQETLDLLRLGTYISSNNNTDTLSKANLTGYQVALVMPKVLKDSSVISVGVVYQSYIEKFSLSKSFNQIVYGINVPVSYTVKLNLLWKSTFIVTPIISSDLKEISSNDFKVRETVLFTKKKSQQHKFRIGLTLSHEYFGLNVVPLIGWYCASANFKHALNVLLPVSLNYKYKIAKSINCGINYNASVDSYRLSQKQLNNYMEVANSGLSVFLELFTKKNFYVASYFGKSINRRFEEYPFARKYTIMIDGVGFGSNSTSLTPEISDGLFIEVKAGFRINQ